MKLGNNILIIVSERIGDVIFCTPAIALLHASKPDANIDVLALSTPSAEILAHNPAIRQIYTCDHIKQMAKSYDIVIDLHNSEKTKQYDHLFSETIFTSPRSNEKDHQSLVAINFIRSLIDNASEKFSEHYRLYPQAKHFEQAKTLLKEHGATFDPDEKLIGCHMGSYKTNKRLYNIFKHRIISGKTWPVEKFIELQESFLKNNKNVKIVMTGTKNEGRMLKLFKQKDNIIDLMDKTKPLELMALMNYLNVFLTGDTGPSHIAVATEIPMVVLFGKTKIHLTGPRPLKPQHTIIEKNPLTELNVETVKAALMQYL